MRTSTVSRLETTPDNIYGVHQMDITAPEHGVEIGIREDRKVIWISVDGVTILRISQIPILEINNRGVYEKTNYKGEYKGIFPFRYRWYSICSRHGITNIECRLCMRGSYYNVLISKISRMFYRLNPKLWRKLWPR